MVSDESAGAAVRLLTVADDVAGQRIDNFLLHQLKGVPRSLVYRILRSGEVVARPEESDVNPLLHYLMSWFPMLLLIGVWIFFMRQMQGGGGRAMGFGKSKAKLLTEKHGRVTFEDVCRH